MIDKSTQAHHNRTNRKFAKKYRLNYKAVAFIRINSILLKRTKEEVVAKFQEKIAGDKEVIQQLQKANEHRNQAIGFLESCKQSEYEDLIQRIEPKSIDY